ncbi:MAG: DUF4136 domain-containing protein [bacterium]
MKARSAFLTLVVWTGLMSCSSVTVKSDYDREANFALYKTFDFLPHRSRLGFTSFNQKRIEAAVEQELIAKGFERQPANQPDFLVAYHTNVKDKIDVDTYGYHYGLYGRRYRTYTTMREYQQSTLVMDFIDTQTKDLIWRGWAKDEARNPDKAKEKIGDTVAKILQKYPPE